MIDDVDGCIALIDLCSSRCGFIHEDNLISTSVAAVFVLHAAAYLGRHTSTAITHGTRKSRVIGNKCCHCIHGIIGS